MNTRKSSPLPNPNDTLKQFRINYEVHYQNYHRYLMGRLEKEKQARNLLLKEFNKYAKTLNKMQENSDDNGHNQVQIKGIKQKMQKIYTQICTKQLQVHKLLQEDQGVILQLYELLNNKGKEIRNYRDSSSKNYTVTFLHHVSNVVNAFQDFDTTLSIDKKDLQQSQEKSEEQQKSQEINSELNQQVKSHPIPQKAQEIQSNREIQTQQTILNPNKQKISNHEHQTSQKMKQKVETSQNIIQHQEQSISMPQKIPSFKEKIQSIIDQYKKTDEPTNNPIMHKIQQKICIELNSSTDDIPPQNNTPNGHTVKKYVFDDNSKKNRLKKKKLLKSCITILD